MLYVVKNIKNKKYLGSNSNGDNVYLNNINKADIFNDKYYADNECSSLNYLVKEKEFGPSFGKFVIVKVSLSVKEK